MPPTKHQREFCRLQGEAKSILDRARTEERELTAAETAAVDAKLDAADRARLLINPDSRLQAADSRFEALEAWGNALAPNDHPRPAPVVDMSGAASRCGWPSQGKPAVGKTYDAMFPAAAKESFQQRTGGWSSPDEFLHALGRNLYDSRMTPMASMGESIPSQGGFSVPTEYAKTWLDSSLETEIVRPRCQIYPMQSSSLRVAGFDNSTNTSSSLLGGFSVEWMSEGGTFTDSQPEMRSILLDCKKVGLFTSASNEVREDGTDFERQLTSAMTAATGFSLDTAFLTGTGAGQPLGAVNATSTVTCPKRTNQAAGTLIFTNLTDMMSRLAPACQGRSVWLAHTSCLTSLATLTVAVGTGGAHIPVMTQSEMGFSILTRPVIFTEKLQTLGTAGDIILADFSQYIVGLRRELQIDVSQHIGFQSDKCHFRCIMRVDGQPAWAQAHTPLNGDDMSWCVKLATRD